MKNSVSIPIGRKYNKAVMSKPEEYLYQNKNHYFNHHRIFEIENIKQGIKEK